MKKIETLSNPSELEVTKMQFNLITKFLSWAVARREENGKYFVMLLDKRMKKEFNHIINKL